MAFSVPIRIDLDFLYKLRYKDEMDVVKWLIGQGLYTNNDECLKCGGKMKLVERDPGVFCFKCGKNGCRFKRAVREGSLFHNSRLSTVEILILLQLWLRKVPDFCAQDELEMSVNTVTYYYEMFSAMCMEFCVLQSDVLGGEGKEVDLFVVKINVPDLMKNLPSQKIPKVRRTTPKGMTTVLTGNYVLAGFERGSEKCFVTVLEYNDSLSVLAATKKYVSRGSILISSFFERNFCFEDAEWNLFSAEHDISLKALEPVDIKGSYIFIKRAFEGTKQDPGSYYNADLAEKMWRRKFQSDSRNYIKHYIDGIAKLYPVQTKVVNTEQFVTMHNQSVANRSTEVFCDANMFLGPEITVDSCLDPLETTQYELGNGITADLNMEDQGAMNDYRNESNDQILQIGCEKNGSCDISFNQENDLNSVVDDIQRINSSNEQLFSIEEEIKVIKVQTVFSNVF